MISVLVKTSLEALVLSSRSAIFVWTSWSSFKISFNFSVLMLVISSSVSLMAWLTFAILAAYWPLFPSNSAFCFLSSKYLFFSHMIYYNNRLVIYPSMKQFLFLARAPHGAVLKHDELRQRHSNVDWQIYKALWAETWHKLHKVGCV